MYRYMYRYILNHVLDVPSGISWILAFFAASCSFLAWSPSSSTSRSWDRNCPSTSATAFLHVSRCSKHERCTSRAEWSLSSRLCNFWRIISFLFSNDSIWRSEDSRCLSILASSADSASWHSRSLSCKAFCLCPTPSDPAVEQNQTALIPSTESNFVELRQNLGSPTF